MKSKYCIIRYCEKVELGASLSNDLQIEAILEDFQKAKKLFENEEFKASKTEDEIVEFRLEEMFSDSSSVILAENKIDDRHVVRRFEIVENSREIEGCPYEGCSLDQRDHEPEILERFSDLDDAEIALWKYESAARWLDSTVGWEVIEYYIEENWYDDDGDWFDGDSVWKFASNNFDIVDIRYELKSSEASLSVEKIHKFTDGIALVEGARTEVLKTFDSESEALEELKSFKSGGTFYGSFFYVKEYYIEKLVYGPNGEFVCSEGVCGYAVNNFDGAAEAFEEAQKIRAFLCDESNIGNCDECAYNEGYDRRYPCGQFRCSVEVHCAAAAECEDEE